jgi:hypothetical protein
MAVTDSDSFVPLPSPHIQVCFKVFADKYDGPAVGLEKAGIPGTDEFYWSRKVEEETFWVHTLIWRVLNDIDYRQIKLGGLESEMSVCITTSGPMPSLYFEPALLAKLAALKTSLDIDVILTSG